MLRSAKAIITYWEKMSKRGSKAGRRDDLGIYLRSRMEANYARYLKWLVEISEIKSWEYEPDTFEFPVKRGTRFYKPDFKITLTDDSTVYHEVKGWMDAKSKTQLKRMAKYHPDVKIVVIDSDAYKAIARDVKGFIAEWE